MVNVNIDFPEEIHRKAKSKAAIKGRTLKQHIIKVVEDSN